MNTKYVIEDATLNNIADAIRGKTNETETIRTLDFASKIANIDLSTEEYMRIIDLTEGNDYVYSQEEINKVDEYINKFGGDFNG